MRRSTLTLPLVALTLIAGLLVGCTGGTPAEDPTPDATTTVHTSPDPAEADPELELADGPTTVARLRGATEVHDAPEGMVTRTVEGTTGFGSQSVLMVTKTEGEWLQVLLPGRPNGTIGWIRAASADLREVSWEVQVDLEARTLTLLQAGEAIWTTQAAIGDAEHPTPTGTFYITDKLDTGDQTSAYGPYALGLSAYSDVLTEFAGGDGQVGIHGTNVPSSIGQAASHGCLRIDNDLVSELAVLLPLGTRVTIS